jgi:hypothetical protein
MGRVLIGTTLSRYRVLERLGQGRPPCVLLVPRSGVGLCNEFGERTATQVLLDDSAVPAEIIPHQRPDENACDLMLTNSLRWEKVQTLQGLAGLYLTWGKADQAERHEARSEFVRRMAIGKAISEGRGRRPQGRPATSCRPFRGCS